MRIKLRFFLAGILITMLVLGRVAISQATDSPMIKIAATKNDQKAFLTRLIHLEKRPETHIGCFETFTVVPHSLISGKKERHVFSNKEMLFSLRSQLEAKGYRFVELSAQPHLLATASVSTSQKSYKKN